MLYEDFKNAALKQDMRNKFGKTSIIPEHLPDQLRQFYSEYNPEDVEFRSDNMIIRFIPASELETVMDVYSYLDSDAVFAVCNGDPIFIKNKQIFTCPEGVKSPQYDFLANSFDSFILKLINKEILM